MSAVFVVTENAGYDVGLIVHAVFSTRQKADAWIEEQGAPSCNIEEYPLDREVAQ